MTEFSTAAGSLSTGFANNSGLAKFAATKGGVAIENAASSLDFGQYLRTIVKRRNIILILTLLGLLLSILYSYSRTAFYESSAQIIIDNSGLDVLPGNDRKATAALNDHQFLNTQIGLIRSDSLAKDVVRRARLAQNPLYADQDKNAQARMEQAANLLRSQLQASIVRDSRLINLSITSPSAAMSASLANYYAEEFIASNLNRDFKATEYSREFLAKQLADTRSKLEDSERQTVDYASNQQIVELGSDKDGKANRSLEADNLVRLNQALAEARIERIDAVQKLRQGVLEPTEGSVNSSMQTLRTQKAELEAEYRQKSAIFLPAYPEMIALKERINSLDKYITKEIAGEVKAAKSSKLQLLEGQYRAAAEKERELASRVDKLKDDFLKLRSKSIQYNILQRDVDTNRVLYEGLLQKFKEVGVTDGIGKNDVTIVDKAQVPIRPVTPNIPINLLIGFIGGFLIGVAGAFFTEFVGDTINLPEDVERKLNLSLLGLMPRSDKGTHLTEAAAEPKSEVAEAANSLRTALQFATTHGAPRSILLSSSRPAEGKSSVSFALAIAFARQGRKVLLVDADMRRPTFYTGVTSRDDEDGLSNVLTGQSQGQLPIRKTGITNLSLMTAGPTVPNPADLLSTNAYAEMLERVQKQFDIVIADGPPVLGLADALLLAAQNEAVVMVVEAGAIRRSLVLSALTRLQSTNAHIVGVVLNKFNRNQTGYGYGYSYDYDEAATHEPDENRRIVLRG